MPKGSLFFENICIREVNKCWDWIGPFIPNGYGYLGMNLKKYMVHRLSYEIAFGPIPKGFFVCHRCDNKSCINPFHLFLETPKGNTQDMIKKKRDKMIGERNHNSKLTDEEVRKIKRTLNKIPIKIIAEKHGVTVQCIYRISYQKSWKHII